MWSILVVVCIILAVAGVRGIYNYWYKYKLSTLEKIALIVVTLFFHISAIIFGYYAYKLGSMGF